MRIESELVEAKKKRELELEDVDHKMRVISYSDSLLERISKKQEDETKQLRESLMMSRMKRQENLLSAKKVVQGELSEVWSLSN
jgi:cyanate lyase